MKRFQLTRAQPRPLVVMLFLICMVLIAGVMTPRGSVRAGLAIHPILADVVVPCQIPTDVRETHDRNRYILNQVPQWITSVDWEDSNFNYGVPHGVLHLLDKDVGTAVTLSDVVSFLAAQVGPNYLEIGVSVGKNLYQVLNMVCNSRVVAFDIERINPTFDRMLTTKPLWFKEPEQQTLLGHQFRSIHYVSPKKTDCTKRDYGAASYRNNSFVYVNCDEFDDVGWHALQSVGPFQVVFSDALHTLDAIQFELEHLFTFKLLDPEKFVLVWDDMGLSVPPFCERVVEYAAPHVRKDITCVVGTIPGWFGTNEYDHTVAVITTVNITSLVKSVFHGPINFVRVPVPPPVIVHTETWTCDSSVDTHDASHTVSTPTQAIEQMISATNVTFLEWGHTPGQLCNRMALLAAAHARMRKSGRLGSFLALNDPYSDVAWTLDLSALSNQVAGILLDCYLCHEGNCAHGLMPSFVPKQLKCGFLLVRGKVYAMNDRVFDVDQSYKSDELWWSDRSKVVGFLDEHLHVLQPKPFLKAIVRELMERYRKELGEGVRVLSVHRRFMDRWCYAWVNDIRAHQCFPSQELTDLVAGIGPLLARTQGGQWERDSYLYMNESQRVRLETENHLLMGCNYTLSAAQTDILKKRWPELFERPVAVLLASDTQDPVGDAVLYKSKLPVKVRTLAEMERASCFAGKKNSQMLAEMIAMSLADFHMDNSLSSCGDIVSHWRHSMGKPKGFSFPQICYDGFFTN